MSGEVHVAMADVAWVEIAPGVERGELGRDEPGTGPALLRFAAGSVSGAHRHPGGEELVLISGSLRVGEIVMSPGDYVRTEPGGVNDAEAYQDSVLFQIQPEPIEFV